MKRVIQASGGIGSWATAWRVAEKYGTADLVLLFADTLAEDEDLYRFNADAAAELGVPITVVCDGRTPQQVGWDRKHIGNTQVANCSHLLKQKVCRDWLEANCDPADTTLYVGIDWSETHRLPGIVRKWAPWTVEAPLTLLPYTDKSALIEEATGRGLKPPRLYELGFAHNNCGGACVKAGQAQWAHLLKTFPDRFASWESHEQAMRAELGKDVSILRDRTGGTTKPLTLTVLRKRVQGDDYDKDDWGGCGCMTEDAPATMLDESSTDQAQKPSREREIVSIPREDLHAVIKAAGDGILWPAGATPSAGEESECQRSAVAVLMEVVASLKGRADATITARKKSWQSNSRALNDAADFVVAYATELDALELDETTDTPPAPVVELRPPTETEIADATIGEANFTPTPVVEQAEQFAGQCDSTSAGERCMLPGAPPHTGVHIGTKGGRWPRQSTEDAVAELVAISAAVPVQRTAAKQITAAGDGYEIVTTGATAVAVLEHPTVTDGGVDLYSQPATVLVGFDPTPDPAEVPAMVVAHVTPMGRLEIVGSSLPDIAPSAPSIVGTGGTPTAFDIFAPASGAPKSYQSPSSIKSFAGCGLKYRFTYREGLVGRPMWAGVGGTAFHSVQQNVDRSWAMSGLFDPAAPPQQYEAAVSELWKAEFRDAIDKQAARAGDYADPSTWYAASGGKEDQAWWWTNGEDMARRYLHTRPAWHADGWNLLRTPTGNVAQELQFRTLLGGLEFTGFIDDVWHNSNTGELRIRDAKSGGRREESDFQLRTYGTGLRALGAVAPGQKLTASYYMARKGEHDRTITLTPADDQMVTYRAQATAAADAAGVFLPNPTAMCVACPFRKVCPAS